GDKLQCVGYTVDEISLSDDGHCVKKTEIGCFERAYILYEPALPRLRKGGCFDRNRERNGFPRKSGRDDL
ncbi:MAG: hypothetical protein P8126_09095, partial [Gammaproteobacteria bacterium]